MNNLFSEVIEDVISMHKMSRLDLTRESSFSGQHMFKLAYFLRKQIYSGSASVADFQISLDFHPSGPPLTWSKLRAWLSRTPTAIGSGSQVGFISTSWCMLYSLCAGQYLWIIKRIWDVDSAGAACSLGHRQVDERAAPCEERPRLTASSVRQRRLPPVGTPIFICQVSWIIIRDEGGPGGVTESDETERVGKTVQNFSSKNPRAMKWVACFIFTRRQDKQTSSFKGS